MKKEDVIKKYSEIFGFEPREIGKVDIPIPQELVILGRLKKITYISDKLDENYEDKGFQCYEHDFESQVIIAHDFHLKVGIIYGKFEVTDQGIIDIKDKHKINLWTLEKNLWTLSKKDWLINFRYLVYVKTDNINVDFCKYQTKKDKISITGKLQTMLYYSPKLKCFFYQADFKKGDLVTYE